MNKKCTKCKVEKPTSEFGSDKSRKDGLEYKCKPCKKIVGKTYRDANSEKERARCANYRKSNKEKEIARRKLYNESNRETIRVKNRAHYRANRHMYRAKDARYHASKLQRTPAWSETREIAWFYKHCPEGMQVDHKYPLQGETVSGLHCLANLQYLSEFDNKSKNNRV